MEHRIRNRHRVFRAFGEEHAGSNLLEFTDALEYERRGELEMIVLRRHNVAVLVKVKKDILEASFHYDGQRETALLRTVYLALKSCPSL